MRPIVIHQTTDGIDCYLLVAGPVTIVTAWQGLLPVASSAVPTGWLFGQGE